MIQLRREQFAAVERNVRLLVTILSLCSDLKLSIYWVLLKLKRFVCQVRALLEDLREVRYGKIQDGLKTIETRQNAAKVRHCSMEMIFCATMESITCGYVW